MSALILFFAVCFAVVAWERFSLAIALFCFLLPAYLIRFALGPLPTTLLELMFVILAAVWLIRKPDCSAIRILARSQYSLFIAIAIFLAGATIGIWAAVDARAALGEWKAFYLEPVVFFLIVATSIKTRDDIRLLVAALTLSGTATAVLAVYQHFTGWMVPWDFWQNHDTYRVTGWWGFPNGVGLYLAPLVPLAFARRWPLPILFVPLAFFAMWYARSTGGIIGSLAGLGVLALFFKKTQAPAILAGIIAILLALVVLPPASAMRQELLLQDRSGQLRVDMWGEATAFLMNHPFVGAGIASYQTRIYPYRVDKWIEVFHHPHNLFLTLWVNIGIVGLVGFVWVVVWFGRVAIQHRHAPVVRYLAAALAAFLVTGLVDSPYIKNDMAMLFWILPALLLVATKQSVLNSSQHI